MGEYVVFYIVTRDHAEFRGSCNITILPSASGKYFNSTHGVISINGFSTSDGLTVSYDLSGVGLIGDKPFSLSDNSITVDGVEYECIDDSDTVHTLTVNGSVVMYFNEAEVNIGVTFDDKGANISINSSVISFLDFNYCESINSAVNDGHACGMTSTVSSEDINIVLSERKTNAFENPYLLCVYDGKPHAFSGKGLLYEIDGKFVAESPSFTEIGTYTVKVLSIKSAYLPAYGTATLVIAPSPDGVYYSVEDKTVVRIENAQAVKNGTAVELSYTEKRWAVDGVLLSEYTALIDGMIFVISVDNVIADIVLDTGNIKHVASDGANVTLLGEEFKILGTFLFSHEITEVYFNGVKKSPIRLPNYDALYGIGISDIESAKGVLNINFC